MRGSLSSPSCSSRTRTPAQEQWQKERRVHAEGGQPSLLRALWRAYSAEVLLAGLWKLAWSILVLLGRGGEGRGGAGCVHSLPSRLSVRTRRCLSLLSEVCTQAASLRAVLAEAAAASD